MLLLWVRLQFAGPEIKKQQQSQREGRSSRTVASGSTLHSPPLVRACALLALQGPWGQAANTVNPAGASALNSKNVAAPGTCHIDCAHPPRPATA